jgi:O-antigen/teichoic acid export membrane protein
MLFGVAFVLIGLRALGGFLSFIFSSFLAFILSLFQLPRWVLKMKRREYKELKPSIKLKDIYSYFLPVSIGLVAYTLFTNSDVILVKHFFSETQAGIYSIAQTVGKIILFLPAAITVVLFPVAVQRKTLNKETRPLLKRSLLFVSVLCTVAFLFAFSFPKFVLRVVSGQVIPECILLVRLIIFPMSLFSFCYIFIFYNLSVRNVRFVVSIFALSLVQIALIYLFHNTLLQIIGVLTVSALSTFYLGIRSMAKTK